TLTIPGCTGYAVPAEPDETAFFRPDKGLVWTLPDRQIAYFVHVQTPGSLQIHLLMAKVATAAALQVTLTGKTHTIGLKKGNRSKTYDAGNWMIPDSGFYEIRITTPAKANHFAVQMTSLVLQGPAVAEMHANLKPRRNAASVHLKYPLPDSARVQAFYNELTVPPGADIIHSYYMACGFARGYFGMQVNGPAERRILFSVWDAGNEAVDRSRVPDTNRVQLLAKGIDVYAGSFGNEGTGGHSHWVYPWKAGITYRFLVTALPDSASNTTTYAGYFFLPETQKWKLIACFRAPRDGNYLRHLYSFNEDFAGINGQLERKAYFGNQWVQLSSGRWKELTESSFSYDATGKTGDRIDYGAGTAANRFYLRNGGFTGQAHGAYFGELFHRQANQQAPVIAWSKQEDSASERLQEMALIRDSLQQGGWDSAGDKSGRVYYTILRQGTGAAVYVSDTVTVHYKGWVLNSHTVFDETKAAPITFPLKRLILGWQLVLPACRVGGAVRMILPSAMAYGIRNRAYLIPPNSILVFDVEVVDTRH
ncbi:MAG TPA: DUF3472 domain-containing protein, partial [Sediminibacterium sp.]|nr:DUF3472 domain-containing protein [Sediminibacterium sp.]